MNADCIICTLTCQAPLFGFFCERAEGPAARIAGMKTDLRPGDRVDVVRGDFANFRNGVVVAISGKTAQVTFEIFGRVTGPVAIPTNCLEPVREQEK